MESSVQYDYFKITKIINYPDYQFHILSIIGILLYEELSGENDDEEQDEEDNEESEPNEEDGENYFSADGGAVSRTSNSASNSNNSNQRSRNQLKIDQCMIRAETCMFMIKLPAYSSFEIMKTRLKQAISTRYDPLIG